MTDGLSQQAINAHIAILRNPEESAARKDISADALYGEIYRLHAELRNAAAEAAACIRFLETELSWEDFRAEGFIGKQAVAASTKNCQALAAFLKEKGNHGTILLAEIDARAAKVQELSN